MATIDKGKEYAASVIGSFGVHGVPCDINRIPQMIADGYVAGASDALKAQWKNPGVETPDDGIALTVVEIQNRHEERFKVEFAPWKDGEYQGDNTTLVNLGKAKVVAWTEIPIFNESR